MSARKMTYDERRKQIAVLKAEVKRLKEKEIRMDYLYDNATTKLRGLRSTIIEQGNLAESKGLLNDHLKVIVLKSAFAK